jgi:hypothetical protein
MQVMISDLQVPTVSNNPVMISDLQVTYYPTRPSDTPCEVLRTFGDNIFYALLAPGCVTLEALSEQYLCIARLIAVEDKARFRMLEIAFMAVRQQKLERAAFEAGPRDDEPQHLSERFSASSVETLAVNPTVLSFSDPAVLSVSDSSAISRARESNAREVNGVKRVKLDEHGSFCFVANNQRFLWRNHQFSQSG